jgi:ATP-dependent helicase/nuclease subunit B
LWRDFPFYSNRSLPPSAIRANLSKKLIPSALLLRDSDRMVVREFLGWDEPFLGPLVTWLLARKALLPQMWIVVPTAQSARRLREALAEKSGALLSPKMVTPGSFLKLASTPQAADWIDHLAWVEVLESLDDWSEFTAIFPEKPSQLAGWANALADEMVKLRRTLQENGLTLAIAASKLTDTIESDRWQALARLEEKVETRIGNWGFTSRSQVLNRQFSLPTDIAHWVFAGVPEIPPLLERAASAWPREISVLIGAPQEYSDQFSALGKPLAAWTAQKLTWPAGETGSIQVVADPRQQALEAVKMIATKATKSDQIALGSADPEVATELAKALTRSGWIAFHPAEAPVQNSLVRWLKLWCHWLTDPKLATVADLLAHSETGLLVGGKRAQKAQQLCKVRDRWMVLSTADLRRRVLAERESHPAQTSAAGELLAACETLEGWRKSFLREHFTSVIPRMLELIAKTSSQTAEDAGQLLEWWAAATPLIRQLDRDAVFWIDLMLSSFPAAPAQPPEGRVIDVQGWLELFHQPGLHLVLCGLNEGSLPARSGGEPWLSEASRSRLGLISDASRHARDAFLYQALLESRRAAGRVDILCGKSGSSGDSLLPSRLLFACQRDELPQRVKQLFREIEPDEASLSWQPDWQWKPTEKTAPTRLSVTSLSSYLACPLRYYLKHVLAMQKSEAERGEWNARDFGTIAHEVLERWGRDPSARVLDDAAAIHPWLSAELDRVVEEWFGSEIPLAIRIQTEALRSRFLWFAEVQSQQRSEGWEIVDVERKVELAFGDCCVVAKIDRIDRHRDSGRLRVIDYKTGSVKSVDKSHRQMVTATSQFPDHFTTADPVIYAAEEKGKAVQFRWHNLQLPLYAAAVYERENQLPRPCYFTLGATEPEVALHEWSDFEKTDLQAARNCTEWIVAQITAKVFWPPANRVEYDDYHILAAGHDLLEMIAPQ